MRRDKILEEIERYRARAVGWNGFTPEHDAQHSYADWTALCVIELSQVAARGDRSAFIRLAALCVAAVEANDRKMLARVMEHDARIAAAAKRSDAAKSRKKPAKKGRKR